jgi:ABC-type polar amino acid transport system ATPase subunit
VSLKPVSYTSFPRTEVRLQRGTHHPEPVSSPVNYQFQFDAVFAAWPLLNLFPHLTMLQNCTLAPMRSRGMTKDEAEEVAMKYLMRVHTRRTERCLQY